MQDGKAWVGLVESQQAAVHACLVHMRLTAVSTDHWYCVMSCCVMLQLTRLLEDSLGGSSKTLLVVNCR